MVYAADRKTLTEKLFQGMQPVANAFVPPMHANFAKDVPSYPYDPAKAKALLAEAGFTPGADGICRNAKGERLSFEFTTTAGNRLRELQQQVLQSNWKAACIEVTIKNEPARTMFGETLKKRSFPGHGDVCLDLRGDRIAAAQLWDERHSVAKPTPMAARTIRASRSRASTN